MIAFHVDGNVFLYALHTERVDQHFDQTEGQLLGGEVELLVEDVFEHKVQNLVDLGHWQIRVVHLL